MIIQYIQYYVYIYVPMCKVIMVHASMNELKHQLHLYIAMFFSKC